jgi:hypothetical protein
MAVCCATSVSGVGLATEGATVEVVMTGRESRASACTVRVESITTTPTSAIDEAPASTQIRSGVFSIKLRDFRFITI